MNSDQELEMAMKIHGAAERELLFSEIPNPPVCPVCEERMVRAHVEMAEPGTWGLFWLCGCFGGAKDVQ